MVVLSVLITTLCLQLVNSRNLPDIDEIENGVSLLPAGNLNIRNQREYVKITVPPLKRIRKNVGSYIEYNCEASGSPPPIIQWYKDHMRITENESFEDSNSLDRNTGFAKVSSRLIINYILPRHQGEYFCVAEAGGQRATASSQLIVPNSRGREMNFTQLIANKILGAHHLPKVTFWAGAYMDILGSDVILPCKSVGNPKPDLTWYDNNSKEILNDDKFTILPDGELNIRSLTWDDMGVFICVLKNSVGMDSVETFLYPMQPSE